MITEFLNYIENIKGYSKNTAIAYGKDLKIFVTFIKGHNPELRWSTIKQNDVDAFISYQVQRGMSAATTNRQLASVGALYNYMRRNGLKVENPVKYESRRKVEVRQPHTIPIRDIETAIAYSDGVVKVMLSLLLETGLRLQEMLDIRKCDINPETRVIRIFGKGHKQRLIQSTNETCKYLLEMCRGRRYDDKVFKGYGQYQTRCLIFEALKPYTWAEQKSPHAIRHTFATENAKQGVNTTTLQMMLGHKKIETTQKYIDYAQMETNTAFEHYQNAIKQ